MNLVWNIGFIKYFLYTTIQKFGVRKTIIIIIIILN